MYVLSVLEGCADQNCAALLGVSVVNFVTREPAHCNILPTSRAEWLLATIAPLMISPMRQRVNSVYPEESMTTNRMSEEFESTFVPTVQRSDSPREFEEDSFGDPKGYTDEQLVAAAQKGVARALGELLMRHRKFLFKTLRRMTDSIEEAEDIVQEAMIRACLGIGRFRREARFSTWLFVIATNCLRSERRRSRPTQWIYLDDTEIGSYHPFDLQDSRPTPEQECAGREFVERAHREIQRLPELYRSALQAQGVKERASADNARDLGITRATFNTRLRKGRAQLAQAMGRNLRGRVGSRRARREI